MPVTAAPEIPAAPEVMVSQRTEEDAVQEVPAPVWLTVKDPVAVFGVLPSLGTALVNETAAGVTLRQHTVSKTRLTVTTSAGASGELFDEIVKLPW